MWRSFDRDIVAEELRTLADHGLAVTRSFFFWPDFHPRPYLVDAGKCQLFRQFLDLHAEIGLSTIPTLIVGHMSGQNWDPSWRGGRDLYTDVWMVGRQAWFVSEMVRRFCDHPAVAAWLISNEMPLYGGGGGLMNPVERVDGDAVRAWGELMVAAVRAGGGAQPVSLGDGAWGPEVTGIDNGFRLSWTSGLVDWLGAHSYHMSDDQLRQNLTPAFNAELCGLFGRPVVLEEFGVTRSFASDHNAAAYYRQVLYSTLAGGVTGWLAWNNTDFDLDHQEPYDHRPFELGFGLTSVDGAPKPALAELARFAERVGAIGLTGGHRPPAEVALVISGYFGAERPFWGEDDNPAIRDSLREAYIAARLADLPPALVRDAGDIPAAALIIVPSAKAVTAPGCRALEAAAQAGSTVWVSYSAGETANQRGWWWPDADATFGVRIESKYGLVEPVDDPIITLAFEEPFGELARGAVLEFWTSNAAACRARLPVSAAGARVVAVDQRGRPAILAREIGRGRLVLCAYPLELLSARTPFADHGPLSRLYGALARAAGAPPALTTGEDAVMVDRLFGSDGREHAIVVNTSDRRRVVSLRSADGLVRAGPLELGPLDARVVTLDPPCPPPSDQANQ
jgi:endo-1,4-beta-mannosidase